MLTRRSAATSESGVVMTLGVKGEPAMIVVLAETILAPTISSFAALVVTYPLSAM